MINLIKYLKPMEQQLAQAILIFTIIVLIGTIGYLSYWIYKKLKP